MPLKQGAEDPSASQTGPDGSQHGWSIDNDNDLEINIDMAKVDAREEVDRPSAIMRFTNAVLGPEAISALLLVLVVLSFSLLPNDDDTSAAFMRFQAPFKTPKDGNIYETAIIGLKRIEYNDNNGMTVVAPISSLSEAVEGVAQQVHGCLKASVALGIIILVLMVGGRFFTTLKDLATHEAQERRVAILRVLQMAAAFFAVAVGIFLSAAGLGRFPSRIATALSENPLESAMLYTLDTSSVSIRISTSYEYSLADGTVVSLLLPAGGRYMAICVTWLILGSLLLLTATLFWAPRQKLREIAETAVLSTRVSQENPHANRRRQSDRGSPEEFPLEYAGNGQMKNEQGQDVVEGSLFTRILNGLIGPEMLSVFLVSVVALSLLVLPSTTDNQTWFELDAPVLFFQQLWLHVSFSLTGYNYLNPDLEKVTGPLSEFSPNAVKAAQGVRRGLVASVVLGLIFILNSLLLRFYISMQASEQDKDSQEDDESTKKNSFRALFHRMVIIRYFRMATAGIALSIGIYLAVVGYGTLPQALRYDLRDNPTNNVVLNSLDLSGLQLVYDTKYTYDENDGAVIHLVGGTSKYLALVVLWFLVGTILLVTTTLLWGHDVKAKDDEQQKELNQKSPQEQNSSSNSSSGLNSPTIEYHNPNFASTMVA